MSMAGSGGTKDRPQLQAAMGTEHGVLAATSHDGGDGTEASKLARAAVAHQVFRGHCGAFPVLECGDSSPLSFFQGVARAIKKESGDESPHSKTGNRKEAAMNRRTPKRFSPVREIRACSDRTLPGPAR